MVALPKTSKPSQRYLIALGSNQRHRRHGRPEGVLAAAVAALGRRLEIEAVAPLMQSDPLGPSLRRFANGAVLVSTDLMPPEVLTLLKGIERHFGRRRGRRWGARVLDLDIILWNGGCWRSTRLVVPHREFRNRAFVLRPIAAVSPLWRDPRTGFTLRQLHSRLTKPRVAPRGAPPGA